MKRSKGFVGMTALALITTVLVSQNFVLAKGLRVPVKTTTTTTTTATTGSTSSTVPWGTVVYDGYGSVTWNSTLKQLTMTPKAATSPSETHAALVVSSAVYKQPFQLSYTMNTTKQLRTGSTPNPWEVGWGVFGYKTDGRFKYVVLKPSGYGVEFGESLLNNVQNFLYTSVFGKDYFPTARDYNVVIKAQNNVITLVVNGVQYMKYTMSTKDALTPDGQYGFYTEDASVKVSNIKMVQL